MGFAKAILVFFISLIAMLLFAAATQGYFIAKSRWYESVALLVVAFMLFRPDFLLDQVSEKYMTATGPAAIELIGEAETDKTIRLRISGPDFDTGEARGTTLTIQAINGNAEGALSEEGLLVMEEDGKLLMEEPFPGTPHFETIGTEYDFYGDFPVTIEQAQVENERMAKEIFFIPALILLAGIVLIQRPRATQAAF